MDSTGGAWATLSRRGLAGEQELEGIGWRRVRRIPEEPSPALHTLSPGIQAQRRLGRTGL